MTKLAILQLADAGPAESTAAMLRAVGYNVFLPNKALRDKLRGVGCDTVLSPRDLTAGMGYDPLSLPEIGPEGMLACDLYCDVKGHRNYARVVKEWPRLASKVLWVRVNGGKPEHVIKPSGEDCGDEANPPCPVLTPDLWYALEYEECGRCEGTGVSGLPDEENEVPQCWECHGDGRKKVRWFDTPRYACWPPFVRSDEYYPVFGRPANGDCEAPICLIHGLQGWGYGALVENVRSLGVACYGDGSPDGLVRHKHVPRMLSLAKAMVHLKSSDAPGYALYEALSAGCPVICTRRLIWRCRMHDLLEPGKTCLVFDRETHEGLSPEDVRDCTRELAEHLAALDDPATNKRIGMAGRERLKQVMWSDSRPADVESLREFMRRNFG